ncbi:GNAT family N-acetyltransferase [Aliagarivorans taiwanensis]|uniref:GNAT family N-acetyltransferase n=1 Tax=Aliagarivorans taiwanensis TaxID=561966 RepID=UPI0004140166|nr:GNAT family N-acetyltransferase [Aliagarivorans taiwanensis]
MSLHIRPIQASDDVCIQQIILQVGKEFGAIGEGFGPSDAEVAQMSQHYLAEQRSRYFVAELNGKVVGGGGIAAFNHSADTCELRKLFILPQGRGQGVGRQLSQACLAFARDQGYNRCYLDTLSNMDAAIALYHSLGFERLTQPLDGTIHNGCDVAMLKVL